VESRDGTLGEDEQVLHPGVLTARAWLAECHAWTTAVTRYVQRRTPIEITTTYPPI
jgi:hypothetical protein